jgi:hypothetical protein
MSLTTYLVDASVVASHLIVDAFTANADTLFAELEKSVSLFVPEFCIVECTNVIWKQVRFHSMPQNEAENPCTTTGKPALKLHSYRRCTSTGVANWACAQAGDLRFSLYRAGGEIWLSPAHRRCSTGNSRKNHRRDHQAHYGFLKRFQRR